MERILVFSDTHVGSTVGLWPGAHRVEGGGEYLANKYQLWLRDCWTEMLDEVKAFDKPPMVVMNGDPIQGVNYRDGDGRRVEVSSKYNQARKRLTKYKNTEFIKKISHEAAPLLPPLDFVYIDGNHSFRNVSQDLLDYYPLIKHGGFIGGHDLFGRYQGVIWAVLNFAVTNDLKLYTAFYDYWFIKGNKFLFPKNP